MNEFNNEVRLQKMIAEKSQHSRRKAEELIKQGKVLVNGVKVTEMGVKVSEADDIVVDGSVLYQTEKEYFLINKPIRVISSRADDKERTVVTNLVPTKSKVYPVGRLDYMTSGLLLLTNDGNLANKLMHPKFKIPKTYIAKVQGSYTKNDLQILAKGVVIDGRKTAPAKVKPLSYDAKAKWGRVEITIYEGRNLQIRKMFETIGTKVAELKRIKYGFIELKDERLPAGAYRELTFKEVTRLYNYVENGDDTKKGKR